MLGDFLTRDLKSWGPFPEVPDVSVPSLITLNEYLRAVANIPREIPHLLNGAKVKPLVKQTNTRRRRYSISHVAALGFLVVAGLALISSPVPYVNTNLKYLPLAVCLLSGSLWIGCRILRRKWGNPKWVADFSEYLSNKLSPKQKMAIISEMKALSDQRQPLFCNISYDDGQGARGITLKAGEIILSGSLVPLEAVTAGDTMHVSIEGMSECEVSFK